MIEILFVDFFFLDTHKEFNYEYFQLASLNYKVSIIAPDGFYSNQNKNLHFISSKKLNLLSLSKNTRIQRYKLMLEVTKLLNKRKEKITIILTYDTFLLFLGIPFIKFNKKMFLQHHNNIDGLNSLLKKYVFSFYKNKFFHLVGEKFVAWELISTLKVKPYKLFVLRHPITKHCFEKNEIIDYDFIALSNSNNEEIIAEIVANEISKNLFRSKKIKGLIRSKKIEFDNGYLKVSIFGHLGNSEFYEIFCKTKVIVMLFPKSFKKRISGTLMQALGNGKVVLSSDIEHSLGLNQRNQNNLQIFFNIEDFLTLLTHMTNKDFQLDELEYKEFMIEYSNNKIIDDFHRLTNNLNNQLL